MATNWKMLERHLQAMNLQVGQTVTLTVAQLQQIVGASALPPFASRVTAWDPVMGGKGGGLQRVMNSLKMFPISFGWTGSSSSRPVLASITLMKWGAV